MGGPRDVSAAAFQQEIDVRRQLLDKVRQVSKDGLSLEEDIDRRLMIGLLDSPSTPPKPVASGNTIQHSTFGTGDRSRTRTSPHPALRKSGRRH